MVGGVALENTEWSEAFPVSAWVRDSWLKDTADLEESGNPMLTVSWATDYLASERNLLAGFVGGPGGHFRNTIVLDHDDETSKDRPVSDYEAAEFFNST